MRLTKKAYALIIIVLSILIYGVTTLITTDTQNKDDEVSTNENIEEEIPSNGYNHLSYYKEDKLSLYQQYHSENPELSIEDIVTHVNMGIHVPFYSTDPIIIDNVDDYETMVVNKNFRLPDNYEPSNLVTVDSMYDQQLVDFVADAYNEMKADCKENGFDIYVQSGYRSVAFQDQIYTNMTNTYGREYTDQLSSRPYHSEHHTGLAADISINGIHYDYTGDSEYYGYLKSIFSQYGFILRYPENSSHLTGYNYESWHVRYVGVEQAKKVEASGLTFDEYMARQ